MQYENAACTPYWHVPSQKFTAYKKLIKKKFKMYTVCL